MKVRALSILFLSIILFNISYVSALCEQNQIDINTASAEELDEIVYIGPARAEQIISLRPFNSVDDLIKVNGIGPVYLDAIKEQGLACVAEEDVEESEKVEKETIENKEVLVKNGDVNKTSEENHQEFQKISEEREMIILNSPEPKVIKTEDDENLSKNYAIYGFVGFCIFIIALFLMRKNKYKNEFGK